MSLVFLLGVDIGTYSSKGVLADLNGQVLADQSCEHELSLPHSGWAEHDPEAVWWRDFKHIVNGLLAQSGVDPDDIAGIGISSISPAVAALGEDGRALRPAILYGIDTRARAEMDELFKLTGAILSSQSGAPKILWLRRHAPNVWAKTHWITNGPGYLNFRLTGENTIDIYDAAGFAPFFNVQALQWDESLAGFIAPLEWMPRPTWTCQIAGRVSAAAAHETGLAEGTPVITGTADAAAEAVSAGLSEIGDMMIMYGSSTFFILKTQEPAASRIFWTAPFLEPGSFCVAGGTTTAGGLTRWFRDQFGAAELAAEQETGENAYAALARLAASSPPGANGLVALPYFYGERTPIHDPLARGILFGLTLKHTRADMYRALLESVGFAIRHNLEVMQAEGLRPTRVLAVGGGTRNLPWMQIICNIAGISQIIPARQTGASYGDAFLAGLGCGAINASSHILQWLQESTLLVDDHTAHRRYELYYQLYRELYAQNAAAMHHLARSSEMT